MRAISLTLLCLFIFTGLAPALSKDDNRMKTAEQAFKEKRYADAKAVFDDLKDKPVYREKSLLYLAMLYYETGQVESSLEGLKDFNRYVTEATDVSLKTSADNLADEINEGFSTLDIAIFDEGEPTGVDPGFYNLVFSSSGGLNPAQESRLGIINKIFAQSQGIFNWKSDGTFLKGRVNYFPVKLYGSEPMTAEINGVPVYFRFDFQTKQGLWIPYDILQQGEMYSAARVLQENPVPVYNQQTMSKNSKSRLVVIGAAVGAVVTAAAIAIF